MGFGPLREALAEKAGEETKLIPIARHPSRGIEISAILRIARHLSHIRPHVLHLHNWSTSLYGVAAAQIAGVPQVFYGSGGREVSSSAQPRRQKLMRALGQHIDGFTSVCEFLGKELAEDFAVEADRIHVIKTGVDLGDLDQGLSRAAARTRLQIPEDATVVGAISVFRPVKRIDDLIAAVGRLAQTNPKLHLLLIGNPVRMTVEDLRTSAAKSGLKNRIHLPGRLENPGELIRAFDIFVNCSDFEGSSNAIIEAMAAGVSVVGTAVGGTPELIQNERTGLLVPPRSINHLAEAIRRLSTDSALRGQYASAARKHAHTHHNRQDMFKAYQDLYVQAHETSLNNKGFRRLRQAKRSLNGLRQALK